VPVIRVPLARKPNEGKLNAWLKRYSKIREDDSISTRTPAGETAKPDWEEGTGLIETQVLRAANARCRCAGGWQTEFKKDGLGLSGVWHTNRPKAQTPP
jgi:hypothetical protein